MKKVVCDLDMCRCCGRIAEPGILVRIDADDQVRREMLDAWKIEISPSDGCSKQICKFCHKKFSDYFEFREESKNSQEKLKRTYKQIKAMYGTITVAKKLCVDGMDHKTRAKSPQRQNQSSQKIITKQVHIHKNVYEAKQEVIDMDHQNHYQSLGNISTKQVSHQINMTKVKQEVNAKDHQNHNQSLERAQKIITKQVPDHINMGKVKQEANANDYRDLNQLLNASPKYDTKIIPQPDQFSTPLQTYVFKIIEQNMENTTDDPLDEAELEIVGVKSAQYPTDQSKTSLNIENPLESGLHDIKIESVSISLMEDVKSPPIFETSDLAACDDEDSQSSILSPAIETDYNTKAVKTKNIKGPILNLVQEIESSFEQTSSLKCKFCISDSDEPFIGDEIFPTLEKLIEHLKMQHDSNLPYKCLVCGRRKFKTRQMCAYHIVHMHKNDRSICPPCGRERKGTLKRFMDHIHRCHSFGDYECETCKKKFLNVSFAKFEYHKRWHNINRQIQCSYCAKIFVQITHLEHHERMMHTKDFKIKCEICDEGFPAQHNKQRHMHKEHGYDKPIKCLYCEKRFNDYPLRLKHMQQMHNYIRQTYDEKAKCPKCNKVFRREAAFRRHSATNCLTDKKIKKPQTQTKRKIQLVVKNFACDQCSCHFIKESGLRHHLELHSKDGRPFECNLCHFNFKTRSNLDTHMKVVHNPYKPHECDVCGKKFAQRFLLNGHKKFHKNK